jgi:hypothetical protein
MNLPKKNIFIIFIILIFTIISMLFPIWGNLPFNCLIPLYLVLFQSMEKFEKLKISTLIFGRLLFVFTALLLCPVKWFLLIIVILMYINIAEAVITNIKSKTYFNVISGLALLASAFQLIYNEWIVVIPKSQEGIVHIGYYITTHWATLFWCIAYTIWNWDFVLSEFSSSIAKYHIFVLLIPFVVVLIMFNPGFWLISRVSSLTTGASIQVGFKTKIEEQFYSPKFDAFIKRVKQKDIQRIMMISVILLSALSVILIFAK